MNPNNRRGILAMVCSMTVFVFNDTLIKHVSEGLPAGQIIFLRGLFASALLLAVARASGALSRWRLMGHRMVAARAAADGLGSLAYLGCLFHVPLGNTTAIGQAVPLFVTVGAVLVLHERVPTLRWVAILAGFGGVLLVVQPGASGFNAFAWLGVLATLLNASRDLMTRFVPAHVPTILVTASAALLVTVFGGLLALFQGFQAMTAAQCLLLFAAAMLLACGYQLLIISMRAGDMSVIAPFRYSGLLFAIIMGYLVWGDVPNLLAWCGIALLVGAGLYMLLGDKLRRRVLLG